MHNYKDIFKRSIVNLCRQSKPELASGISNYIGNKRGGMAGWVRRAL